MSNSSCGIPLCIDMLLHFHISPEPYPTPSPVAGDILVMLCREGLITADVAVPDVWLTTPRGRAHVQQLCNLPFPREAYVDQAGKEIAT